MYLSTVLLLVSVPAFTVNAAPPPVDYELFPRTIDLKDLVTRGYNVGMLQ